DEEEASMFQIRQAANADQAGINALLSLSHTDEPTHRLQAEDILYVADSDAGLIGVGGLDPCGDDVGLLHSLLVRPGFRKQRIARQLYQHVLDHAYGLGIRELFTLTASGRTYFETLGFIPTPREQAPESLRRALLRDDSDPEQTALMYRPLARSPERAVATLRERRQEPATQAAEFFDSGFYCAESVLLALARHMGMDSPWIPRIATGFCNGLSRTWGTCGAYSGGVLALNLALGRSEPGEPVQANYDAIQRFTEGFRATCGGGHCSELLGCDLQTEEGRRLFRENNLHAQCREYVIIATRLGRDIIDQHRGKDPLPSLF
ncbi:MAG TPA: C-GCAxxG-C-C family (seleno)protein, partial [Azospira sp.]|nr:C-GCAxxG-C-C family (seleno)protein [Azospira sp.]